MLNIICKMNRKLKWVQFSMLDETTCTNRKKQTGKYASANDIKSIFNVHASKLQTDIKENVQSDPTSMPVAPLIIYSWGLHIQWETVQFPF